MMIYGLLVKVLAMEDIWNTTPIQKKFSMQLLNGIINLKTTSTKVSFLFTRYQHYHLTKPIKKGDYMEQQSQLLVNNVSL